MLSTLIKNLIFYLSLLFILSCSGENNNEIPKGFQFEYMYSKSAQVPNKPKEYHHYIYIANYEEPIRNLKKLICTYQDTVSYDKPIRGITLFDSKKGLGFYKKKWENLEEINTSQIRKDIVISVGLKKEVNGKSEKCPPIESYYPKNFKGYGF